MSVTAAIERERERRHWTIAQLREADGDEWPWEASRTQSDADAAVDLLLRLVPVAVAAHKFTLAPHDRELFEDLCCACEQIKDSELERLA